MTRDEEIERFRKMANRAFGKCECGGKIRFIGVQEIPEEKWEKAGYKRLYLFNCCKCHTTVSRKGQELGIGK